MLLCANLQRNARLRERRASLKASSQTLVVEAVNNVVCVACLDKKWCV